MIKGVFFDWGFTLAHPEPDREIQFYQCAQELGISLPLKGLLKGVHEADNQVPKGAPPRYSEDKDKSSFIKWWDVLLTYIGGDVPDDTKLEITKLAGTRVKLAKWVLYDDVLPTLERLKNQGLILGLISNISIHRAGLEGYFDVIITAKDVGAGKPEPIIFSTALRQSELAASQVLYVGDQYEIDVLGANRIGMQAILIDRYDLVSPVEGCSYITCLSELADYLS
jgi:putative hydrolase of the HAD superfamily